MRTMKFLLVGLVLFSGALSKVIKRETCGVPSLMTNLEQVESINIHNKKRSSESAADELEMTFDQELADRSQEWADKCIWDHGLTTNCNGDAIGQNMYLSGGGAAFPKLNMTAVVTSWYNEKVDFDFTSNTCAQGKVCGHYTQVVWAKSHKVGCAYAKCPSVDVGQSKWENVIIVVCDYSPAGNYKGSEIYAKGTPCSKCADQVEQGYLCTNNLCSPCLPKDNPSCKCEQKAPCQNDGIWDQGICSCSCKPGFYGKACENSCDCKDLYVDVCPTWSGFCSQPAYDAFMKQTCPKTCK
ncbi:DgyrCDS14245 [Dimorphilus gyrociliatus]|uniref:DgyrCDS14245 n=1 Tax=Dimorphilus gyrociliatus TaxID=2664684 RepID=A0A7I8WD98_9ANNE|nr:DgyrCDS14245 [Dimorphilus gyrociliatus]